MWVIVPPVTWMARGLTGLLLNDLLSNSRLNPQSRSGGETPAGKGEFNSPGDAKWLKLSMRVPLYRDLFQKWGMDVDALDEWASPGQLEALSCITVAIAQRLRNWLRSTKAGLDGFPRPGPGHGIHPVGTWMLLYLAATAARRS